MAFIIQGQNIDRCSACEISACCSTLRPCRHIIIRRRHIIADIGHNVLAVRGRICRITLGQIRFNGSHTIFDGLHKILDVIHSRIAKGCFCRDIQIIPCIHIGIITDDCSTVIAKMGIGNSRSDYILFRCGGGCRCRFTRSHSRRSLGRFIDCAQGNFLIGLGLGLASLISCIGRSFYIRTGLDGIRACTVQFHPGFC